MHQSHRLRQHTINSSTTPTIPLRHQFINPHVVQRRIVVNVSQHIEVMCRTIYLQCQSLYLLSYNVGKSSLISQNHYYCDSTTGLHHYRIDYDMQLHLELNSRIYTRLERNKHSMAEIEMKDSLTHGKVHH